MRSILFGLLASAACGGAGNQSSGDFTVDIIEPSCTTTCTKGSTNTATLEVKTTVAPDIDLAVTLKANTPLSAAFPAGAADPTSVKVKSSESTFLPFTFVCDGDGGTLSANAASVDDPTDNTNAPGVEIMCPGAAIETANVVATAQITVDQAGTETSTHYGGVKLIGGSTRADRDLARDALIKPYRDVAVGECKVFTFPGSPTLVYQDIPANTQFAKVGGGAPLTFATTTGFLTSTPELGVSYDATIAAAGSFIGITAPGLSAMPPLPGGFNGGVLITSGNLMGESSPGYNLGNFTPTATTMPTFSWAAPSPMPTDVIVRIFDRSENDPSPPTTTICRLPPNATSWTMPMPVFTALTLNTSGMNYDVTSIDLYFANIAVAPVTLDEAFLNVSEARLKNMFLRKKP